MWDIFTFPFFQRALIGGLLIGGMAPLLGMFLVLRRLSMIGDTISHVSIAGIALGFLINVYPVGVGLVFSLLAAIAIERLRSAYRTYAELSIAIIMSGGVALATFLFTLGQGFNINVTSYFFGSIYSLDMLDLYTILGVSIVVLGVIATHTKEYFLLTFDEDAASVGGLPVRALNLTLTVLTALVISVAIKIVGALLVSALITIPVACSLLVAKSFKRSLILAVVFSEIAVLFGLIGAGTFNLAPGASIVLLLIAMLIGLLMLKKGFRL
ncbi:metal ABC transporter permease [Paenibacillus antri]|uniref:Metal ABC transporter permease n=1 Tax=Paenibacillus antri TaxID=2582848 RepID=A0A5R9GHU1_9BACL|nr:metal ABC transporter permease [Paenibacillus antri]TLS52974.1 metal ABC transporter permease [Paenibacillus antri]